MPRSAMRDSSATRLTVQYGTSRRRLPAPVSVRRWAHAALERAATVTIRFVGTREGRALNAGYRRRDYATNVLTFVYEGGRELVGDVALCSPVVLREARERRLPPEAHFAHLVVHGLLHLQGYDHGIRADAAVMEGRESAIMSALGYADPWHSGARQSPRRGARSIARG